MTDSTTAQSQQPDSIPWYTSKVIWIQIVGALAALAGVLGHAITPDEQQNLVTGLTACATLVVTVLTIYHRVARPCPPVTLTKATKSGS